MSVGLWLAIIGIGVSSHLGIGCFVAMSYQDMLWERARNRCVDHWSHKGCVMAWSWAMVFFWPLLWPWHAMEGATTKRDPERIRKEMKSQELKYRKLQEELDRELRKSQGVDPD